MGKGEVARPARPNALPCCPHPWPLLPEGASGKMAKYRGRTAVAGAALPVEHPTRAPGSGEEPHVHSTLSARKVGGRQTRKGRTVRHVRGRGPTRRSAQGARAPK